MDPILFFNRHSQQMETELVYGESFLDWTYNHPLGKLSLHTLVKKSFFSRLYGKWMDHPSTAKKIQPFIEQYQLNPDEFLEPISNYPHFNSFFYRKLKPTARPIDTNAQSICFPADGRHLGFPQASQIEQFFVKGQRFNLKELLGDAELAREYADGTLILSRLCPVDYHRFHFPCEGTPRQTTLINGPLYSVSPIALRNNLNYLWENKRTITPLDTPHGRVLLLEIGATCVGSILQTFSPEKHVLKGEEKGYFAFGGSSTITIFPPGSIQLEADLLQHSANCTELYAQIGTPMAHWNH